MADQRLYQTAQEHGHQAQLHGHQEKTPQAQHLLAVAALLPLGGFMLLLSALTLTGTVVGLAVATPLFVIFSPVLVPAALAVGLATMGFLVSGVLGLTALSALSWMINYVRRVRATGGPGIMDEARWRVQEGLGRVGEKTKDVGQGIQDRAGRETGRTA